jgi:nucleotide-binding universal stress UspA family protein
MLYHISSERPENQIPEEVRKIIQNAKQQSEFWLNKISHKIASSSVSIDLKTEVVVGLISVVGAIVKYVERKNINLIVMGTRGRSGFKRLSQVSHAAPLFPNFV